MKESSSIKSSTFAYSKVTKKLNPVLWVLKKKLIRTIASCCGLPPNGQLALGITLLRDQIQNAYFSLIRDSKHYTYIIENQFFISSNLFGNLVQNNVVDALVGGLGRLFNMERSSK